MKKLIIGRAGSGKSSVARELLTRGYDAYDADKVPGLARWEDAKTGQPTRPNDVAYIDSSKFHWNWQTKKIDSLLASKPNLFLCGGADNDLSFASSFDQTFILNPSPRVQSQRLQSMQRSQENTYGTHPDMIPIVLAEQAELAAAAAEMGATVINADQPIDKVVDDILNSTHEN
jgi:adenylate kinase family enzyme